MGPVFGVPRAAPRILRWLLTGLGGGEAERSMSRALEEDDGFGVVVGGGGDSSSDEWMNSEDSGALVGLALADLACAGRVEARRSRRTDGVGFLS